MATELNWRGSQDLMGLLVALADVEPDPRNARLHPAVNMAAIKASIDKHGQLKPIVAKGRRILAGNGTYLAIKELGWNAIAVAQVPEGMTDELAIAYALADNKTTDLSEWDFEEVASLLKELPVEFHLLTGFQQFEIDPLLKADFRPRDGSGTGKENAADVAKGIVTFRATLEQAIIINEALSRVRAREGQVDMPEGRILELICADFIAGAPLDDADPTPPPEP